MSHRKLKNMFEEYNHKYFDDLMKDNIEFAYLAGRYHDLDLKIHSLSADASANNLRERLKKHRLIIKDEAYAILIDFKNANETSSVG